MFSRPSSLWPKSFVIEARDVHIGVWYEDVDDIWCADADRGGDLSSGDGDTPWEAINNALVILETRQ